jgi:hypothetical protein
MQRYLLYLEQMLSISAEYLLAELRHYFLCFNSLFLRLLLI